MIEKWIVSFTDQNGNEQQVWFTASSKTVAIKKIKRMAELRHMENIRLCLSL